MEKEFNLISEAAGASTVLNALRDLRSFNHGYLLVFSNKNSAQKLFLVPGIFFFKVWHKAFVIWFPVLNPTVFKTQGTKKINSFKIFFF